ncbi:hypothetical protein EVAR_25339_1 [Eumeta japonica]|uniref:Uncharacterized protein n=1 Tax=Eumeta variegata TaxID=151549 RepID=A0A4C1XXT8_EUMVA|nr:hypothetical protein EVAR_25339_1 [Eumeta japonica]
MDERRIASKDLALSLVTPQSKKQSSVSSLSSFKFMLKADSNDEDRGAASTRPQFVTIADKVARAWLKAISDAGSGWTDLTEFCRSVVKVRRSLFYNVDFHDVPAGGLGAVLRSVIKIKIYQHRTDIVTAIGQPARKALGVRVHFSIDQVDVAVDCRPRGQPERRPEREARESGTGHDSISVSISRAVFKVEMRAERKGHPNRRHARESPSALPTSKFRHSERTRGGAAGGASCGIDSVDLFMGRWPRPTRTLSDRSEDTNYTYPNFSANNPTVLAGRRRPNLATEASGFDSAFSAPRSAPPSLQILHWLQNLKLFAIYFAVPFALAPRAHTAGLSGRGPCTANGRYRCGDRVRSRRLNAHRGCSTLKTPRSIRLQSEENPAPSGSKTNVFDHRAGAARTSLGLIARAIKEAEVGKDEKLSRGQPASSAKTLRAHRQRRDGHDDETNGKRTRQTIGPTARSPIIKEEEHKSKTNNIKR